MRTRKRALIPSLLIGLAIVGVVWAAVYYMAGDTTHSVITSSGLAIELHDLVNEEEGASSYINLENVLPGQTYAQKPYVKNADAEPVYVRVKLVATAVSDDGTTISIGKNLLSVELDNTHWTKGGDDFYYYNSALSENETTEPVFSAITFSEEVSNEYQNSTFTVTVKAEAVQVINNGSSALEALGWPEE